MEGFAEGPRLTPEGDGRCEGVWMAGCVFSLLSGLLSALTAFAPSVAAGVVALVGAPASVLTWPAPLVLGSLAVGTAVGCGLLMRWRVRASRGGPRAAPLWQAAGVLGGSATWWWLVTGPGLAQLSGGLRHWLGG